MNQEAVERVRQNVQKFFKFGPTDIVEFLYGYARKTYTKNDLLPKMKLLLSYLETAQAIIECEHADASFVYSMLKAAAFVLYTYNTDEIPEEAETASWLVRFLKVCKTVKTIHPKIEAVQERMLQIL